MDLAWNDERTRRFVTNVGLITSRGPIGDNVMAAEWTHHISYAPSLMSVHLSLKDATVENIRATKVFGINLAASDQATLVSVAGNNSGREVDKIAALKELGFSFYPAKKIDCLMVEGAAMNAECEVLEEKQLGDHIMFVGRVVEISADAEKEPLVYHNGKFWHLGERVSKPPEPELKRIEEVVRKHKRG